MKPKRGVVFVGEAGVGTLRVKPPVECLDKTPAVPDPFVKRTNEKGWSQLRKPLPPGMARRGQSPYSSSERFCNFINQALDKRPELRIGCRPVSSTMRRDGLIEMPHRYIKAVCLQERVDFVVGFRKVKGFGQGSAQLTVFNGETISLERTTQVSIRPLKALEIEVTMPAREP